MKRIPVRLRQAPAFAAAIVLGSAATATAADLAAPEPVLEPLPAAASPWHFSVTPYAWAMSLNGNAAVRGFPANVDVGFDTILENLEMTGMVEVRARYNRFGVFGNFVYGRVGASDSRTLGPALLQTKVTSTMTFIDYGVFYHFDPIPLGAGGAGGPTITFEPYAGARYTNIGLDVRLNNLTRSGALVWTDPIVGLRTAIDFNDRWAAVLSGDIGGFGAGSDFSWNLIGVAGYRFGLFSERDAAVFAGYRALGQDYSTGSGSTRTEWDVVSHGPVFGLSVRF